MHPLTNLRRATRFSVHLLRNFLLLPDCPVCHRPLVYPHEKLLCSRCRADLKPSGDPACPRCGRPVSRRGGICVQCWQSPPPFSSTRCVSSYAGIFREVILCYKYGGVSGLSRPLSRCLPPPPPADCVEDLLLVRVPDDPGRRRPFSPLGEMARRYARLHGLHYRSRALVKVRSTPRQAGLSLSARQRNLVGMFRCRSDLVKNRHVILLDDVFTTGCTLRACAGELKRAGAKSVRVITLARTP